jgi:hypothetical protein
VPDSGGQTHTPPTLEASTGGVCVPAPRRKYLWLARQAGIHDSVQDAGRAAAAVARTERKGPGVTRADRAVSPGRDQQRRSTRPSPLETDMPVAPDGGSSPPTGKRQERRDARIVCT